jgi:hypothetical protein
LDESLEHSGRVSPREKIGSGYIWKTGIARIGRFWREYRQKPASTTQKVQSRACSLLSVPKVFDGVAGHVRTAGSGSATNNALAQVLRLFGQSRGRKGADVVGRDLTFVFGIGRGNQR